jgi:hypothetical protein
MKNQEQNTETITVEQKLSVEELEKVSQQLASLVHEYKAIEDEQKDVNKGYNDRKKTLKETMNIRADEVETAIRKTQVNVTKHQNTRNGTWEYVDEETGDVVKTEPLLLPPAPLFDNVEAVYELPPAPIDYEEFEEVETEA